MEKEVEIVKEYYDTGAEHEWERLSWHWYEMELTVRMMKRHIQEGDKILDIGGGPGRYSIYFAERGCDVTLVDLSDGNIAFAKEKAREKKVGIQAAAGDARDVLQVLKNEKIGYGEGGYDHVFLMGPLYHLLEEEDRIKAVKEALRMVKPGGLLYVSFISMFANTIYFMQNEMAEFCSDIPEVREYRKLQVEGGSYAGPAFTQAYFAQQKEIVPFMDQFELEMLHFFGQESILSPCEEKFLKLPKKEQNDWIAYAEALCEKEELLSFSEHLMYIGRKV